MTLPRRSLLLGLALATATLFAADGAAANTVLHHHTKKHGHAAHASHIRHHAKSHRLAAAARPHGPRA